MKADGGRRRVLHRNRRVFTATGDAAGERGMGCDERGIIMDSSALAITGRPRVLHEAPPRLSREELSRFVCYSDTVATKL